MDLPSSGGREGDISVLHSPLLEGSTVQCISFYLHMQLEAVDTEGALVVYKQELQGGPYDSVLLAITGDQGRAWTKHMVRAPPGRYYLAFEATIGFPYVSDIALDDIKEEDCTNNGNGGVVNPEPVVWTFLAAWGGGGFTP